MTLTLLKACKKCQILQTLQLFSRSLSERCQMSTLSGDRSMMGAWQIAKYGGVEELAYSDQVKIPTIRNPCDVLVEVYAASVNPIDLMVTDGYGSMTLNAIRWLTCNMKNGSELPLTLGRDFSGVVRATGKAVPSSKFKVGDQVWGAGDPWKQGAHAAYTTVSAWQISKKPQSLNHVESASLPYVAATTWAALHTFGWLEPRSMVGKRVLVIGGSGGIGTFAIQLIKSWGAEVVTTCATDALDMVLGLGADIAIDYTTQDVFKELQHIKGFDVILDTTGNNPDNSMGLLKKLYNARYITLTTPFLRNNDSMGFPLGLLQSGFAFGVENFKALKDGQTYRWGFFVPNGQALKKIADLVDKGKISPVVEKVYPFSQLPEAYEKVQAKHNRGKTVIDVANTHQVVTPEEEEHYP